MTCLATKGWEAPTVSVIAAEAGISRGALQHHYPTREDLVLAAVRLLEVDDSDPQSRALI